MRIPRPGAAGGLLAAVLLVSGCSDDKTAEVAGTVTVDGAPAANGSITFIPADGKTQTAGCEIKDGKYAAKVPVGATKVAVRVPKVVGKKKLYDTPDSPVQDLMKESLPARYNDQTELQLDVRPGKNEKNWELMTK